MEKRIVLDDTHSTRRRKAAVVMFAVGIVIVAAVWVAQLKLMVRDDVAAELRADLGTVGTNITESWNSVPFAPTPTEEQQAEAEALIGAEVVKTIEEEGWRMEDGSDDSTSEVSEPSTIPPSTETP